MSCVTVDLFAPGESHLLFNAGGGSNGTDLLLEITHTPARHGEQLFETLAGELRGQAASTVRPLLHAVGQVRTQLVWLDRSLASVHSVVLQQQANMSLPPHIATSYSGCNTFCTANQPAACCGDGFLLLVSMGAAVPLSCLAGAHCLTAGRAC